MTFLLAAVDGGDGAPWERMIDVLRLAPDDVLEEWRDPASDSRLAQIRRRTRVRQSPMFAGDRYVVVFDGRLLPRSASASDAERVAEAYERRGAECARDLAGDYAFALWDREERVLMAACDPVGLRTIAYFESGGTLLLSSRAVALLPDPRVPRRLDEVYLAHAICDWWAQPPGTTAFAGIRRVRPGFALIHRPGSCEERRVDSLRLTEHTEARAVSTRKDHHEQFWGLLHRVVADAVEPDLPVGLALSSGLDSACVMLALLEGDRSLDALSIVADGAQGNDERAGIRDLLRENARVRWHPVDCSADRALSEPWDALPIPDEPVLLAAAFVPARLRLARAARDLALELLVDGEGGDELFGMSARFGDLVAERDWGAIARYVKAHGVRGSLLHELVLPRLPPVLRDAWLTRRWKRADPFPPWMSATFRDSDTAREALDQRREWAGFSRLSARLPALLEVAPTVGSRSTMQLLLSTFGIEGRSPLLDRRLVEFVGSVPAHLLIDPLTTKGFLRRALEGRVPSSIVQQPKTNGLYQWMQERGLSDETTPRLCERIETVPWLRAWVRPEALVQFVQRPAMGLPNWSLRAEQACSLLSTARWLGQLGESFGLHWDA